MATYNGLTAQKPNFHIARFHVTGGNAATNLTCTGINTSCTILWVDHISTAASVGTIAAIDLDEVSITAANAIQLASTATNNDQLMVVWTDPTL